MKYDIVGDRFTLHFPDDWDERAEYEMPLKGHLNGATVETAEGVRFPVFFFDPVRLQQELEMESAAGRPFIAEPGMIVVSEVTRDILRQTVEALVREEFFVRNHIDSIPVGAS